MACSLFPASNPAVTDLLTTRLGQPQRPTRLLAHHMGADGSLSYVLVGGDPSADASHPFVLNYYQTVHAGLGTV